MRNIFDCHQSCSLHGVLRASGSDPLGRPLRIACRRPLTVRNKGSGRRDSGSRTRGTGASSSAGRWRVGSIVGEDQEAKYNYYHCSHTQCGGAAASPLFGQERSRSRSRRREAARADDEILDTRAPRRSPSAARRLASRPPPNVRRSRTARRRSFREFIPRSGSRTPRGPDRTEFTWETNATWKTELATVERRLRERGRPRDDPQTNPSVLENSPKAAAALDCRGNPPSGAQSS